MGDHSFIHSVLAERANLVYRVNGMSNGRQYWAYVLIEKAKLEAFEAAIAGGDIHVQSYGRILAWGVGDTIPDSVRQDIKRVYNFDLIA